MHRRQRQQGEKGSTNFSDGSILEWLLNTILKLDAIESWYDLHAQGKTKFYPQTIGQALEHTTAEKKFQIEKDNCQIGQNPNKTNNG